jgi:hypothetical protein
MARKSRACLGLEGLLTEVLRRLCALARDREAAARSEQPMFYFSAVDTLVKVVLRLEPTPATATMIAIEIPAAMRPYSIAVAPRSFRRNWSNRMRRACPLSLPPGSDSAPPCPAVSLIGQL